MDSTNAQTKVEEIMELQKKNLLYAYQTGLISIGEYLEAFRKLGA